MDHESSGDESVPETLDDVDIRTLVLIHRVLGGLFRPAAVEGPGDRDRIDTLMFLAGQHDVVKKIGENIQQRKGA